ncbi:MAG: Hpt domain-containing protein [Spirochaetes bacterium]|nr:Hpt domain-containing protein [Spirochaetota bacterium]
MDDYAEKSILDTKSVLSRIGGDELRLKQLYSFSLHEIRKWNEKVSVMINSADFEEIRKTIHGFKGSSATIGAERCRSLFAAIETLFLNGQNEEALKLLQKCPEEITNLIEEIINKY